MAPTLQDPPPFKAYAPEQDRPLRGYAALMTFYAAVTAAFGAWFRASGRRLPERVEPYDLALLTVATHKSARLITKEKVTAPVRSPFTAFESEDAPPGEVEETVRVEGTGLRRALGELLVCPYCLSMWIATAMAAGMLVSPRLTRQVAAVFTALFGSDVLHAAYRRLTG